MASPFPIGALMLKLARHSPDMGVVSAGGQSAGYCILVIPSNCTGCDFCEIACKGVHEGKPGAPYIDVKREGGLYLPALCMHCKDPPCAGVCPVGTITKLEEGPVVIDQNRCIGCMFCASTCPFGRIHYDRDRKASFKCDMCRSRIAEGKVPACVEACRGYPPALYFGAYEDMLEIGGNEAQRIGGSLLYPDETSTIYVVTEEERKGLNLSPSFPSEARITAAIARYSRFALVPVALGVIGYLLWWRGKRIERIEEERRVAGMKE